MHCTSRTYPFHFRLSAVLKFPREHLWKKLPEPFPNSSIYDRIIRCSTPRPTFGVARTAKDDKWAFIRRRAGTHEPVLHPEVGREARQCELPRGHSRADRYSLPTRWLDVSGVPPSGKLREQSGCVRVCRMYDVRTCQRATGRL